MRLHVLLAYAVSLLLAPLVLAQPAFPPVFVEVQPVTEKTWQSTLQAVGSLKANQGIVIKSEVSGRITEIFAESGAMVESQEPLFQINPTILNAQLAQANAELALSKLNYERQMDLRKRNVGSQNELDKARTTYEADLARVQQIKAQLDQTLIKAPFKGKLGLKQVDLGDYVTVGQALINLQDVDPMQVEFKIPEIYLQQLKPGLPIEIRSRSYPNQVFTGTIEALDARVDPQTRSIPVRGQIPNPQHALVPGVFVEITVLFGEPEQVKTIPLVAVNYEGDTRYVYRIEDGKAVKQFIQTGNQIEDDIIVLDGLNLNDFVVTAGQVKLRDGAPVVVANQSILPTSNSENL